jgi:hypothetical protein
VASGVVVESAQTFIPRCADHDRVCVGNVTLASHRDSRR